MYSTSPRGVPALAVGFQSSWPVFGHTQPNSQTAHHLLQLAVVAELAGWTWSGTHNEKKGGCRSIPALGAAVYRGATN